MGLVKKIIKSIGLTFASLAIFHSCYKEGIKKVIKDCSENSQKIKTTEQLEERVKDIRKDLNVGKETNIYAEFHEGYNNASILSRPYIDSQGFIRVEEGYLIQLNKEKANECSLKHEMDHIVNKHLIGKLKIKNPLIKELVYWYRYEPQAVAYGAFNLKL